MVQVDGVQIQQLEATAPLSSPALIGVCLGAALLLLSVAAVACFCYRRRGSPPHKLIYRRPPERSVGLRRPTAVRSPGSQGHYLKKSPSPTGKPATPGSGSDGGGEPGERAHTPSLHTPSPSDETTTRSIKSFTENELSEPPPKKDEPETTKLGQLNFRVRYNSEKAALLVTIVQCVGLPARGAAGTGSDPYVKLQLLPERQHKVKTRVLRNTQDPVYEEDFTFYGIQFNKLESTTLHFVVLSFDRYSRDDVIGEVLCPMSSVELAEQDTTCELSRPIAPRSIKMKSQGRGELLVSLCHQPAASRLTVVVLKARNLPKMDITGLSDPYVKIYLLCNGQRITKKKTHVKKRTLNPVFNESFVFELPPGSDSLAGVRLEFLLLDWDRVTKNEVIGRLELGTPPPEGKRLPSAAHHWSEIASSPRRQIAEWHKLTE
ncbi:LOW QUALITY PROTEIN: synaptotagmin-11-like [Pollicipes pollicipes]|uniref:LOW QUALITY PROTEIN: synaptotagmin-11-like n=1 Tax=Pollicipes pollicipes TaxID=41117 RepID=UPI0018851C24|nr:LOW QUALITY PROTEIN: synaptotagmin-11-like [Pollicipes pollicipes]